MSRFALAVAIALCLSPSRLYAQSPRFTVTTESASIYQAPSAASPVIGHSTGGAVLDVRAESAGWIEVAWPNAAKGVAYVRTATGRIEKAFRPMTIDEYVHGTPAVQGRVSLPAQKPMSPLTIDEFVRATSTSAPASGSSTSSAAYVKEAVAAVAAASTPRRNVTTTKPAYVAPAHSVGLGARIGDLTPSIGATGRVWSRANVGAQFEIFRDARINAAATERVTSMQFAPSVLYALPNAVSDYFWLRPYIGGGPRIYRSTLHTANPAEVSSLPDTSLGLQLFGGGEVTFAGVPRFALSADVGYRRMQTEFAGFERRKIAVALSGHWFVR